jgi:hypothetical protein
MGTSRVWFAGNFMDAPDPVLEVWLRLLVLEVDRLERVPDWLRDARNDWQDLATQEFGFGVVPNFDCVVTEPSRRALLRELGQRVVARLEALGDPIPADALNGIGAGSADSAFPHDVPASTFTEPAIAFVRLLDAPAR